MEKTEKTLSELNEELQQEKANRIQLEEALQKSESRLKETQRVSHVGFWELDLHTGEFIYLSDKLNHTLKNDKRKKMNLNQVMNGIIHLDDKEKGERAIASALSTGILHPFEFRMVTAEGKERCIYCSGHVIYNDNGDAVELHGINQDITERKQVEKSLRESGVRHKSLVNNMNSGVAVYKVTNDGKSGSDYIIQDFNKFALQHEGLELKDIVGKSLKDLRPTIDEFGLIDTFRKVWKSGDPEVFPASVYVDEKYSNYYENRVFRLPSGEIVAIYDDVTTQKRAEENLIKSENLLREVINNMEKAVAIYEPVNDGEDFVFVDMNEFGEKITKYKIKDIKHRKLTELFPEEAAIGLVEKLRETHHTGKSTQISLKQYKDDRITLWVENYIFKLPSGKVVAMFEDTFEKRQAEDYLRKSEERFRKLIDQAADTIIIHNFKGQILDVNKNPSPEETVLS